LKKRYTILVGRRHEPALELMMGTAIGLALANSAVLVGLIYLYSRIAMKTKGSYSVGLALFAGLLLMHNLLTIFAYVTMAPLFGSDALPFLSGIGLLEFGGLLVLLKLTL
jgi:hypothetical protein